MGEIAVPAVARTVEVAKDDAVAVGAAVAVAGRVDVAVDDGSGVAVGWRVGLGGGTTWVAGVGESVGCAVASAEGVTLAEGAPFEMTVGLRVGVLLVGTTEACTGGTGVEVTDEVWVPDGVAEDEAWEEPPLVDVGEGARVACAGVLDWLGVAVTDGVVVSEGVVEADGFTVTTAEGVTEAVAMEVASAPAAWPKLARNTDTAIRMAR